MPSANSKADISRIDELIKIISEHDHNYYVLDAPKIDDYQYDLLMKELEKLEKEHPEHIREDSPTRRVSGKAIEKFENFKHPFKMLSLNNAMNIGEFHDFYGRVVKEMDGDPLFKAPIITCEHKFDGLAIELIYEEGTLAAASTRGNGEVGELITANVKTIRSAPLRLKGKYPRFLAVYGEALMFKSDFDRLNQERMESGEPLFANPRNAAAGSLRQLDPAVSSRRNLKFYAYGARSYPADRILGSIDSHNERLNYLIDIGFPVNEYCIKTGRIDNVIEYHNKWEESRGILPYDIDGIVAKIDSIALQNRLGYDARSPKWAIAWKFKPAFASTILRNVEFSVGRQGTITPTAGFDPVTLAGAKISRATLHNFDEIKRLDLKIGDTIIVERSGEVIPKVISVVMEKRTGAGVRIAPPDKCPVCSSKVVKYGEEVALRCVNPECPALITGKLRHFVSRNCFNIEGLGEENISRFFELGFIKNYADIFLLKEKREILLKLDRFGEKSVDNLLNSIEISKNIEYWRFINALGVDYVGEESSRLLAEKFCPLDILMDSSEESLMTVQGIGGVIAKSVFSYFNDKRNRGIILNIIDSGVVIIYPATILPIKNSMITGKKFVFTGRAESFSREKLALLVRQFGGITSDSVSKNTDYLIAGENPGSKLEKAVSLGIKILNEKEFLDMIGKLDGNH